MKLLVATVLLMVSAAVAAPLSVQGGSTSTDRKASADGVPPAQGHVPTSTCADMTPIHGNNRPSNEPAPYKITVTPTSANPGDTVTVHISGTEEFRGVYIQARKGDEPVGEFLLPSEGADNLALSNCPPGNKNALTYISGPTNTLDITWKAPNINDEIVFRATFVKTFAEFWVGVESPKVAIGTVTTTDNAVAA